MVRLTEIIPAIRTDQDVILLEIGKLENGQKGPGYWKLNCSLLADDAYVNIVTELLPLWAAEGRKELNIRAHTINFSKRKSKERDEKEKTLQEELSKAKKELQMAPSDLNASQYLAAQEKLETFYKEKTKGIIIQACARMHEYGEKTMKYFLNLEKRNHVKKHI